MPDKGSPPCPSLQDRPRDGASEAKVAGSGLEYLPWLPFFAGVGNTIQGKLNPEGRPGLTCAADCYELKAMLTIG